MIKKVISVVTSLIPVFFGNFFPGSIRKYLPLLPQIFNVLDALVAASINTDSWNESKARAVIKEALESVSDGNITRQELSAMTQLILTKYDFTKAAISIEKAHKQAKPLGLYKSIAELPTDPVDTSKEATE